MLRRQQRLLLPLDCCHASGMLRNVLLMVLLLSGLARDSHQKSTEDSASYKAGVVEFHRSDNGSFAERIAENAQAYAALIREAGEESVDILVFPEATLNYYSLPGEHPGKEARSEAVQYAFVLPDPAELIAPCDQNEEDVEGAENAAVTKYSEYLRALSCEARNADMYVLVNVEERAVCTEDKQREDNDTRPCAIDGVSLYNTNVVFDRRGRVISRYRKFNLFVEPGMNVTRAPELATFPTDFGVVFGHFVCFDILFYAPATRLVRERGVTDFLFPTMWFSQMPFLTAIQVQENWAYVNDVNLLAAGASDPRKGSGGSGIYGGQDGPLVFTLPSEPTRRLLVSEVAKKKPHTSSFDHDHDHSQGHSHDQGHHGHQRHHEHQGPLVPPRENNAPETMDRFAMLSENMTEYANEKIKFGNFTKKLCSDDKFCCTFDLKTVELPVDDEKDSYEYRAVVFNGVASWADRRARYMTCAVVSCAGPDISQCGHRFANFTNVQPRMRVTHARVTGDFPAVEDVAVVGTSLSYSMTPLSRDRVHVTRTPAGRRFGRGHGAGQRPDTVSAHLHGPPADDLHAFGLYARDYRTETMKSGAVSSLTGAIGSMLLIVSLTTVYLL